MMKKLLVCGLVVLSFLLFSAFSVCAVDDEKTFPDDPGDVSDAEGNIADKPNVDIIQVAYSRTGGEVTLTLTVSRVIENRGDINDEESLSAVSYEILLYTSDQTYDLIYVNEQARITISDETTEEVEFDVEGAVLSFTFDLESTAETYQGLVAAAMDIDWTSYQIYIDEFQAEDISVDAGGPYTAAVGESISFSGSVGDGGTSPYEWDWDFDEDYVTDSTGQNPTFAYAAVGEYVVSLTVTDSVGYMGYDTAQVTITAAPSGNNNNNDNKDSGSGILVFVALIAIVAIAGIAALVYFLRR